MMASMEDPLALLERSLIDEYLTSRGYTPDVLETLPRRTVERILADAGEAASLLMAQIDSRARYIKQLAGDEPE